MSRIFSCSQNEKKSRNFELKMELEKFKFCSQNDLEKLFSEAGKIVPKMGKILSFPIPRSRKLLTRGPNSLSYLRGNRHPLFLEAGFAVHFGNKAQIPLRNKRRPRPLMLISALWEHEIQSQNPYDFQKKLKNSGFPALGSAGVPASQQQKTAPAPVIVPPKM